jgi:O-methyltransferase
MTDKWFENVCRSALGHRTSQEATYDIARQVLARGIPGDFVECGVYAGASCALMAKAIMDPEHYWAEMRPHNRRRVHLFDTFAGIPPPGENDYDLRTNKGGESACSLEDVKANMARWGIPEELLRYHPGPFFETVPFFAGTSLALGGRIAMLRLDADLYESTRVPLEQLYPLVSPGGYIIVDDFNLDGARLATLEYFKFTGPAPIMWRKPV